MKRRWGALLFLLGMATVIAAGWLALPDALYRGRDQPLLFNHALHVGDEVGLTCEDCHPLGSDGGFAGIPPVSTCAVCHREPVGASPEEGRLVAEYVGAGREPPWLVYARQPDHVHFPHSTHVVLAGLGCACCHGAHGGTDAPPLFESNRLSGYSRNLWGHSLARLALDPGEGKKMSDCSRCHRERGIETSCLDCHK